MGVYLNQLPPPEIARLKAELAETIIANFCYPRFFDYRTNSLRMRPVDRAKRQEVWLFLSSVDFATWGRVDLTTPDLQKQIERLFIMFVQRNRSFFGEQGRRRMPDIRMLITSSATSVAQGLRGHLSGQRQSTPSFGSPRPVVTWSTLIANGKAEPSWEQIANATIQLQQQLQELRSEVKPVPLDNRAAQPVQRRIATSASPTARQRPEVDGVANQPAMPKPATTGAASRPLATTQLSDATHTSSATLPPAASQYPAASTVAVPPTPSSTARRTEMPAIPVSQPGQVPTSGPLTQSAPTASSVQPAQKIAATLLPAETSRPRMRATRSGALANDAATPSVQGTEPVQQNGSTTSVTPPPVQARSIVTPSTSPSPITGALSPGLPTARESSAMRVGEDDLAIFEEMRTQLIVWLRIEAIRACVDISGQTPPQLLELLRQQGHLDETRLQVVSTLLNLASQVLKNGQVSVLDYKQALMFHLMHTRYWK